MKHSLNQKCLRELEAFFSSRKQPAEDNLTRSPYRPCLDNAEEKFSSCTVSTPKKIKIFLMQWLKMFLCFEKFEVGEQKLVICTWCKDAKKNLFATTGSTNLQHKTFTFLWTL